jgi:SARP family transcriptional regulator, regulator of embCAB operon
MGQQSQMSCTVPRATRYARAPGSRGALTLMVKRRPTAQVTGPRPSVGTGFGAATRRTRIELFGRLTVEIRGQALEAHLPGRQGRMVLAYLAANRGRPVSRDELMGALWPGTAPAAPGPALSTVLTRLRRSLGDGVLEGRYDLWLRLPADAWVDLEAIEKHAARAETALPRRDLNGALEAGREALALSAARLLPEFVDPWVEERRRELEERRCAMFEVCARAGLALGDHELGGAERVARALVTQNPYRESGYALLMKIHAARGDVAEALRVYDKLRRLLREELGIVPSRTLVELNDRLLRAEKPTPSRSRNGGHRGLGPPLGSGDREQRTLDQTPGDRI